MIRRCLLLLTLSTGLLAGCAVLENIGGREQTYDAATTLRLVGGQPRTLDPALTRGGPGGALGHIFSGLVTLDQQLQLQPDLAAGWTVSDDSLVYTFFLRRDARFHNGRSVTAADIVAAWERAVDPATGSDTALTYLGDIVGVAARHAGTAPTISGLRILDDYTLEVTIDAPKVYFLAKLAYPVAFVVDWQQVADPAWQRAPNGTGPFQLIEWRDDERLVLARAPTHYAPVAPGDIEHIVYDMSAGLPLALYETGAIDLVGVGGGTLERMLDPNNPLGADLQTAVDMCTTVIGLNTRRPPFDDERVRQAFNHALDKERLITTLASGQALVAEGALPPGMPGFVARPASYPFDPDRARSLLEAAGYGDGLPPLTYTTSGYDDPGALVTAAVSSWSATLGVSITVELIEPFNYLDELYGGRVGDIYSGGWCADYPDPQNFLDVLYHSESNQNLGGFRDVAIDARLVQARSEPDPVRRLALYQQIENDLIIAAPVVFIQHSQSAALVSPALVGYRLTPIGVRQWDQVQLAR